MNLNPVALGLKRNFKIDDIWEDVQKNKEEIINETLFNYTLNNLNKGIDKVFSDLDYTDENFALVQKFKQTTAKFAAHKTAWQTAELRQAKKEKTGSIDTKYNTNYLRAEQNFSINAARSAKNWQNFAKDQDIYPYLEYMPSVAANQREEHKEFYGIIKAISDPFWDTYLPPNGWNCKCSVQQRKSNEGASDIDVATLPKPPSIMRQNYAKTGEIFSEKHPMIAKIKSKYPKLIKPLTQWQVAGFTGRKLTDITYLTIHPKTGGVVYSFDDSRTIVKELKEHKETVDFLANNNAMVELLAAKHNIKSIDAMVWNIPTEFKKVSSKNSIDKQLQKANKQGREIKQKINVVLYQTEATKAGNLIDAINDRLGRCQYINEVFIIKDKRYYKYLKNTKGITEVTP